MKEVANTQYVACMNPTAGSFHITPRMQRHFVTLALHMPSPETIRLAVPTRPDYFEQQFCQHPSADILPALHVQAPLLQPSVTLTACAGRCTRPS